MVVRSLENAVQTWILFQDSIRGFERIDTNENLVPVCQPEIASLSATETKTLPLPPAHDLHCLREFFLLLPEKVQDAD